MIFEFIAWSVAIVAVAFVVSAIVAGVISAIKGNK